MAQKPSIPKGTRDFNPAEVAKRDYIFEKIKTEFKKFGFQPIETPSFENSDTLMGKYGEEGDRLIFKILNSGDYLSNFNQTLLEFIKEMIFHFNDLSERQTNSNFDSKNEAKFFLETFEKRLKETNNKRFSDEKFPKKYFIDDLTYIIQKNSQEYPNFENLAKNRSELAASIIFSDFYYRLNPSVLSGYISEKALRYDLTVPFARYVVQHQNEIDFPFKRYQIQPVWRADRPQKGRFREFFQCDADVVGSKSLWQEVEFVQLYDAVFSALQLEGVTIKINNRKVLSGFAEVIGEKDKLIDFTVALDKLDKIGEEGVKKEMQDKGISESAIEKIQPIFTLRGNFTEKIAGIKEILSTSETGMEGIKELEFVEKAIKEMPLKTAKLDLDVTLARGLNYYTGAIFEVSAPENVKMGSIGGGGRYDDLTGIFGLKDMSGVGISFGLDRIYLVLEELNLFPEAVTQNTKALFINFGDEEALYALKAVNRLRAENVTAELFPDATKMKKQMNYANKREIPFVILAGGEEMQAEKFTLKNMKTGEQQKVDFSELVKALG